MMKYDVSIMNDTLKELKIIEEIATILYKSNIISYLTIELKDDNFFNKLLNNDNILGIYEICGMIDLKEKKGCFYGNSDI